MAYRLQNRMKKKIQLNQSDYQQNQYSLASHDQTQSISSEDQQYCLKKYQPIIYPYKNIPKYCRDNFRKGQLPFPHPHTLYRMKNLDPHPSFIRTSSILLYYQPKKISIPLTAWITPFARQKVCNVNLRAPLRCSRCRAYINLYFQMMGNKSVTCNLCGFWFEVNDKTDKINMQSGQIASEHIIDYHVSDKAYHKKRVDIIKIIILIELSIFTKQLGLIQTITSSLKTIIQNHKFEQNIRIGIGFIRSIDNQQISIFLIPNNNYNIYCNPLIDDDYLFHPNYQQHKIINCLHYLQSYVFLKSQINCQNQQYNYIYAIKNIKLCFQNQIGRIILFSYLKPKSVKYYSSKNIDNSKFTIKPLHNQFQLLSKELLNLRIGIDHFQFSNKNIQTQDLATTHFLSSTTGGQLYFFQNYNDQKEREKLYYKIYHNLTRKTYYNIDFICRASTGLKVVKYGIPGGLQESNDITLCTVSSSASFSIELQQQKLVEGKNAFIQFAIIYTTGYGQRKIRIINYKFNITSNFQDFYNSLDYLTFANLIARNYSYKLLSIQTLKCREDGLNYIAKVIYQYQKNYKIKINYNKFITPKRLQISLSYLHSIFNSNLFLSNKNISSDQKILIYLKLQQNNPYQFSILFYPMVYSLSHQIYQNQPYPGDIIEQSDQQSQNQFVLPQNIALNKEQLKEFEILLFEGVEQINIIIQKNASEQLLIDLFGTIDWELLQSNGLPQLETAHNIRVNNIIAQLRRKSLQNGEGFKPIYTITSQNKIDFKNRMKQIIRQDSKQFNFFQFIQLIHRLVEKYKINAN